MPFSLTKRIIGFVSGFGGIAGGCDYNPGDWQSAQWQRPDPPKVPWEPHTSDQLVTLTYSRICPQIHRKEKSKSNQSGTHLICTDIHREITLRLIKFMNMYGITSLAESCAMYDIHNTCSTFLFWRLIAADPHKKRILSPSCSSLRMEIKKLRRFFENVFASFWCKDPKILAIWYGQSRISILKDIMLDLPFWWYDLDFCSCWWSTLYNGLHNLFVRPYLPVQPTYMKLFLLTW